MTSFERIGCIIILLKMIEMLQSLPIVEFLLFRNQTQTNCLKIFNGCNLFDGNFVTCYAFILQALLASSYSMGNYKQARLVIYRVIQVTD